MQGVRCDLVCYYIWFPLKVSYRNAWVVKVNRSLKSLQSFSRNPTRWNCIVSHFWLQIDHCGAVHSVFIFYSTSALQCSVPFLFRTWKPERQQPNRCWSGEKTTECKQNKTKQTEKCSGKIFVEARTGRAYNNTRWWWWTNALKYAVCTVVQCTLAHRLRKKRQCRTEEARRYIGFVVLECIIINDNIMIVIWAQPMDKWPYCCGDDVYDNDNDWHIRRTAVHQAAAMWL